MDIKGFFGQYRFLSNYHLVPIDYEGIIYPSSEHAYQAAKSIDPGIRDIVSNLETPKLAKRYGKTVALRPDWDIIKYEIMLDILKIKFNHPDLKDLLDSTGNVYLEETNYWKDTYWGVCDGVGQNNLGQILMKIRDENKSIHI